MRYLALALAPLLFASCAQPTRGDDAVELRPALAALDVDVRLEVERSLEELDATLDVTTSAAERVRARVAAAERLDELVAAEGLEARYAVRAQLFDDEASRQDVAEARRALAEAGVRDLPTPDDLASAVQP